MTNLANRVRKFYAASSLSNDIGGTRACTAIATITVWLRVLRATRWRRFHGSFVQVRLIRHPVIEGVELQEFTGDCEWRIDLAEAGESRPFVLAQSARKTYRLCRSELDVPMEIDFVGGGAESLATWEAFDNAKR